MPRRMSDEQFDKIVAEAIDSIPENFAPYLQNVLVVVEDEPPEQLLKSLDVPSDDELFGFYEGVPMSDKSVFYESPLPDTIYIYRGPHLREFSSRKELLRQIQITVLHEIAHHFGLSEEDLKKVGFD